jgi:hypothetical protein
MAGHTTKLPPPDFLTLRLGAVPARFRGQFIKLLKCMYEEFLPELGKSKEADVQVGLVLEI